MIQEILTYLIITLALLAAGNNILKVIWKKNPEKNTKQFKIKKGCNSCSTGCTLDPAFISPEVFAPHQKVKLRGL